VITTPDLINALATDVPPVRRMRAPFARAVGWLLLAALILTLIAISHGVRPDLWRCLSDPAFLAQMGGTVLTGILATIAAFMASLPDRSRLWLLLPVPALVLWLSTIGYQCLTDWVVLSPDGIRLGEAARCFATLVLTSLPLSLALLIMLRHAARLRPTGASLAGGLAVAAIASTALSLYHELDASAMILMWNLGTAVMFLGLAGAFGRKMLGAVAPRSPTLGN
jgi:hypothetical protein